MDSGYVITPPPASLVQRVLPAILLRRFSIYGSKWHAKTYMHCTEDDALFQVMSFPCTYSVPEQRYDSCLQFLAALPFGICGILVCISM